MWAARVKTTDARASSLQIVNSNTQFAHGHRSLEPLHDGGEGLWRPARDLTSAATDAGRKSGNKEMGVRPEVADDLTEHERALMGFKTWETYGTSDEFGAEWARPGKDNLGERR